MSNVVPIKTLDEHLDECEERYQNLEQRLDVMSSKLDHLELLLHEIHYMVSQKERFEYQ